MLPVINEVEVWLLFLLHNSFLSRNLHFSPLLVLGILKSHLNVSRSGSFSFNLLCTWKAFYSEVLFCLTFKTQGHFLLLFLQLFPSILSLTLSYENPGSTVRLGLCFQFSHIFHLFLFVLHLGIYFNLIFLISSFNLIPSLSSLFDFLKMWQRYF